jgi:hypothetical protein
MLSLLLLAATAQAPPAAAWYGPAEVAFQVQFAGDPDDLERQDVRVRFVGERQVFERAAFFDGEGFWRVSIVASEPGRYRPVLLRRGEPLGVVPEPVRLELDQPLAHAFARPSSDHPNRWRWASGELFLPIGPVLTIPEQLGETNPRDLVWARLRPWAESAEPSLAVWDELLAAGVPAQVDVFDHPGWSDHPWNRANDGFLGEAAELYTDPEALRRTRARVRVAAARLGRHPNLIAWTAPPPSAPAAWRDEMTLFLRLADPYDRPVVAAPGVAEPRLDSVAEALLRNGPAALASEADYAASAFATLRQVLDRSGLAARPDARVWTDPNRPFIRGLADDGWALVHLNPSGPANLEIAIPGFAPGAYDLEEITTADRATHTTAVQISSTGFTFEVKAGETFLILRRRES